MYNEYLLFLQRSVNVINFGQVFRIIVCIGSFFTAKRKLCIKKVIYKNVFIYNMKLIKYIYYSLVK
jgi:hypothetical protein